MMSELSSCQRADISFRYAGRRMWEYVDSDNCHALREGNADYAREHWKTLGVWANYLLKEGLDPENQLCTDDFAGHLAHNANLSIKAIIGIAGYGKLAEMLGDKEQAVRYVSAAREMAEKWERMADDGDHYRLTFDRENTWSQKYNLVWDRVLGLHIFPDRIARKEVAFYLSRNSRSAFRLTAARPIPRLIGFYGQRAWQIRRRISPVCYHPPINM